MKRKPCNCGRRRNHIPYGSKRKQAWCRHETGLEPFIDKGSERAKVRDELIKIKKEQNK
jgi:hypothetical protein